MLLKSTYQQVPAPSQLKCCYNVVLFFMRENLQCPTWKECPLHKGNVFIAAPVSDSQKTSQNSEAKMEM